MKDVDVLYYSVEHFLKTEYRFRRLRIYDLLNDHEPTIKFTITAYFNKEIDEVQETATLVDRQINDYFGHWIDYSRQVADAIADEFVWRHLKWISKQAAVARIIRDMVENSTIVKDINFNPLLANLKEEGRTRVNNARPSTQTDERRMNVSAEYGQKVYICNDARAPYFANPGYIVKVTGTGSYRVMFFSNFDDKLKTTKSQVANGWGFTTASGDEIGLTPEQAVFQRMN